MDDADVLNQLSESFSGVHMDLPVETIVARGRSRQRHQSLRRIVTGTAAALAVVVHAVLTFRESRHDATRVDRGQRGLGRVHGRSEQRRLGHPHADQGGTPRR